MTKTDRQHGRTTHAFAAVSMAVFQRVKRPYLRTFRWWHSTLASLANRATGQQGYFEYDPWSNEYVIVGPHGKHDPDQYEVGHTAGKLAGVLAFTPLFAMFFLIDLISAVQPFLPKHWAVATAFLVLVVAIIIGMTVSLYHGFTLSVSYQVKSGTYLDGGGSND